MRPQILVAMTRTSKKTRDPTVIMQMDDCRLQLLPALRLCPLPVSHTCQLWGATQPTGDVLACTLVASFAAWLLLSWRAPHLVSSLVSVVSGWESPRSPVLIATEIWCLNPGNRWIPCTLFHQLATVWVTEVLTSGGGGFGLGSLWKCVEHIDFNLGSSYMEVNMSKFVLLYVISQRKKRREKEYAL